MFCAARFGCIKTVVNITSSRRRLGAAIRRQRQGRLTQEQLAEKARLSVVFISLLENGRRTVSVDALLRIARVLKVSLKDLVEGIK